jgi:hypothetical protein
VNYDEVYESIIQASIEEVNAKNNHQVRIHCIRGVDITQSGAIATHLTEQICQADISITDITSLNPNVLFELGIRLAVKDHLNIIICHEGTVIPFNLKGYRCIDYRTDLGGGKAAKKEIVGQVTTYLDSPDKFTADASTYYRNVNLYTGREAAFARLSAFDKAPEVVAVLASQLLKDAKNLKLKNKIKTFFNAVGESLKREPLKAVKHYEMMLGIEGLNDEDRYEIIATLYGICGASPILEKEAAFYLLEMEKLEENQ